jgi:hypothetical protein
MDHARVENFFRKEEKMTERKRHGTKALGFQDYEFNNEALDQFNKLSFIDRWRVLVGKKLAVGAEQRLGWNDNLPFYLFKCENKNCNIIAKDYPHGFIERQHLNCSACGTYHDFTPWWVLWAQLRAMLRISFN